MKIKHIFLSALALMFSMNVIAQEQDVNLASWMSQLPDDVKVRELSLPGSHNAATSGLGGGFLGDSFSGKAQSFTIAEQWDKGVRVFDLRPRESMEIYHGTATGIYMADIFETIKGKLEANPNDFAIFLIRLERDNPDNYIAKFRENIVKVMENYDDIVAEFSPSMKVKNARGKIIILTRTEFPSDKAAFLSSWKDNSGYDPNDHTVMKMNRVRGRLYLQDMYNPKNNEDKKTAVSELLNWSSSNHTAPMWVVNYTSGYTGSLGVNSGFVSFAKAVAPAAVEALGKIDGRAGIIMMDFAGDDSNGMNGATLVNAVINQNWKYLAKSTPSED